VTAGSGVYMNINRAEEGRRREPHRAAKEQPCCVSRRCVDLRPSPMKGDVYFSWSAKTALNPAASRASSSSPGAAGPPERYALDVMSW